MCSPHSLQSDMASSFTLTVEHTFILNLHWFLSTDGWLASGDIFASTDGERVSIGVVKVEINYVPVSFENN